MDPFVKLKWAKHLCVLVDLAVGILRFLNDLLLIHHVAIEAHSYHIANTSATWISNIVYRKYRKLSFVSHLQRNLVRHRFLLQRMQLFITVFAESLTSSLARNQVHCLVKQKNSSIVKKVQKTYRTDVMRVTEIKAIKTPKPLRYFHQDWVSRLSTSIITS